MMAILGFLVFAGALAASLAVFAFTLLPALPRIAALLAGYDDEVAARHAPPLVLKDRRAWSRAATFAPARAGRVAA